MLQTARIRVRNSESGTPLRSVSLCKRNQHDDKFRGQHSLTAFFLFLPSLPPPLRPPDYHLSSLRGVYGDAARVRKDGVSLAQSYASLRPNANEYFSPDGTVTTLLTFTGTVPVFYKGVSYNIPVELYVPAMYPSRPPIVYVRPTSTMSIKPSHKHVDAEGMVYMPYLHEWNPQTFHLIGLCQNLSAVFAADPPVFAKSSAGTLPPPPAPAPTQQQQQQQQQQQRPPPVLPSYTAAGPPPPQYQYSSALPSSQGYQPPPSFPSVGVSQPMSSGSAGGGGFGGNVAIGGGFWQPSPPPPSLSASHALPTMPTAAKVPPQGGGGTRAPPPQYDSLTPPRGSSAAVAASSASSSSLSSSSNVSSSSSTSDLLKSVTLKLQSHFTETVHVALQQSLTRSQSVESRLNASRAALDRQCASLAARKEKGDRALKLVREREARIDDAARDADKADVDRAAAAGGATDAKTDPDKLLRGSDPLSEQMLELNARVAAIEDAFYLVDEMMEDGSGGGGGKGVTMDAGLKEIRKLAKAQFIAKAHIKKIMEILNPEQSGREYQLK